MSTTSLDRRFSGRLTTYYLAVFVLDRIRFAITSQPWRTAALSLGLALVASLFALAFAQRGSDSPVAGPSTTVVVTSTLGDSTSTTAETASEPATTTTLVPDDSMAGTPTLGVRIDNAPGARPQWGLNQADLVIEYPVEGGLTRFTAIFPSGIAGLAGPVRSLRPVDADLLTPLTDVLATSGGQPFVIREVASTGIELVIAQLSSLFPSVGNPDPHDTFVDLALLEDFAAGRLAPPSGLPDGRVPEGLPATSITLPIGDVRFEYDPDAQYVRHDQSGPVDVLDLEGGNSTPLTHDTLVVLFAAERPAGYSDVNGVPVVTFDVIGSGRLMVFHDGQVVEGAWSRSAQEDPFVFLGPDGEEFGLSRGKTYMAIVPRGLEVTFD